MSPRASTWPAPAAAAAQQVPAAAKLTRTTGSAAMTTPSFWAGYGWRLSAAAVARCGRWCACAARAGRSVTRRRTGQRRTCWSALRRRQRSWRPCATTLSCTPTRARCGWRGCSIASSGERMSMRRAQWRYGWQTWRRLGRHCLACCSAAPVATCRVLRLHTRPRVCSWTATASWSRPTAFLRGREAAPRRPGRHRRGRPMA
mmetsp:Transcript_18857/g.56199  ORF Transcript_18857/g.56199 Transcript_18857/m.56199 type:complete len:202 (+) Transcript_18857:671-1276(+)